MSRWDTEQIASGWAKSRADVAAAIAQAEREQHTHAPRPAPSPLIGQRSAG
jgi:hypothetical protein